MPHLPIDVDGGSVKIKFPGTEGTDRRIEKRDSTADDTIPAAAGHREVTLHRYVESDPAARIYLIEIWGSDRSGDPLKKYKPNADGHCLIRVHYVAGNEVKEPIPADMIAGAEELG